MAAQPTPVPGSSQRQEVERHSSDYEVELPPELLDTQQRLGLVRNCRYPFRANIPRRKFERG